MDTVILIVTVSIIIIIISIVGIVTINKKTITYKPNKTKLIIYNQYAKNIDNRTEMGNRLSKNIKQTELVQYYDKNTNTVFDRVKNNELNGAVCTLHTWGEKDPILYLLSTIPFVITNTYIYGFLQSSRGKDLYKQIGNRHNIKIIPCGISGLQLGGWWKAIPKVPEDLKGLKVRFHGIGGIVMKNLGAQIIDIAPEDLYTSFSKGIVDVVEWSDPKDDLKMKFYNTARICMVPGWHELGTLFHLIINLDIYKTLTQDQQEEIETLCKVNLMENLAKTHYDDNNAMVDLTNYYSVRFVKWSEELMTAFERETKKLITEWTHKDPLMADLYAEITKYTNQSKYEFDLQIVPIVQFSER
jgi:TRAP-type mannitol/chloroaromatic compound transport system substrate-binding protein